MKITVKKLDEWGACGRVPGGKYSDKNLTRLFRGRKSLTLSEVLDLRIPAEDKIWVATRPGVLTKTQTKRWLDLVVTRAVKTHALKCGVSEVERWAVRWLSGGDRTARAARAAAEAAAWAVEAAARARERSQQIRDLRRVLEGK